MTGSGVRFGLLGRFEITVDGRAVAVGGPTAQSVLVVLVRRPGVVVLPHDLLAAVWAESDLSVDSVYHHIARLRAALRPAGVSLRGCRPGYRLDVDDKQVDSHRFDELAFTARRLRNTEPAEALRRLQEGLGLWRGPTALPGLPGPTVRTYADQLDARRLDAEEDLARLELDDGNPEVVLDRLRTLATAHPQRGGLTAVLMRALHLTGRTEEALALYQHTHDRAVRQGREPHRAVRHAHQDILDRRQPPPRPATSRSPTAPFQLPAATTHFTGRISELDHLLYQWPHDDQSNSSTLVVSAVDGMAGIGKTALAVHAAHHLAGRFPDGVMFIDMNGFTPDTEPTPPEHALDHLMRGLGVPSPQIPPGLDARIALYRSVLATRRVLVVLDNAADENQIRPLLPATRGCLTLITSRQRLTGLNGADHLTLGTLQPAEAVALFTRIAGDRATGANQQTIEHIVAACGHLPLAIRIIAARLTISRATTPAALLNQLTTQNQKALTVLDDGQRTVAAAFGVSYHHLTVEQQTAFRRLGLHPGPDLEPHAAAALLDTAIDHTQTLLDDLERANLLEQATPGRYRFHDLTRAYAEHLAHTEDTTTDQETARRRLSDHYAHTASAAMSAIYPQDTDRRPRPPTSNTPSPTFGDNKQAETWLDIELENLLAAAHHAASRGWSDHTLHQSATLHWHLRTRGRHTAAIALHQQALRHAQQRDNRPGEQAASYCLGDIHRLQGQYQPAASHFMQALTIARGAGDHHAEQNALTGLGNVHHLQGRYGQATDCYQQALTIARATANRSGEQNALTGLGHVHWLQGRYRPATDCYQQALTIARATANRSGEQNALIGLGHVHRAQGKYERAADYYGQALTIARGTGNSAGEQSALHGLGSVYRVQGEYEPAADCFTQVLAIARATGNSHGEQSALHGLGHVHHLQNHYGLAVGCFEQALAISHEVGDRNMQFEAHQSLGRVHHATGDHDHALTHHHTAMEMATNLGQPADQARAHDGLARTYLALGNADQARHHWNTALNILTGVGTDNTEEPGVTTDMIRARLTDLESAPPANSAADS